MGNAQSGAGSGSTQQAEETRQIDYYELLEIDEEANDDEIKKAFRKAALKNHPDKNPDNIEAATKLFADIQQAYEVLSDPQERAWYDRHRNQPVALTDDGLYQHVSKGESAPPLSKRRPGEPGVSMQQLMRFFDPKLARTMDDSKQGFFSVYRSLFELLSSDEQLHDPNNTDGLNPPLPYPTFGDSSTPYAPPTGSTRPEKEAGIWVRDFYTVWGQFATNKNFEWVSAYDVDKAGYDRKIRRYLDKENKSTREQHRKEYNNAVKELVTFIQHRDPRYHNHQRQRQRSKKEAAAATNGMKPKAKGGATQAPPRSSNIHAQMAQQREAAASSSFAAQSWQQVPSIDELDFDDFDVSAKAAKPKNWNETGMVDGEGESEEEEAEFECVACDKVFASEKSWENHEKSKKHKQAVYRLQQEMLEENEELGLDTPEQQSDEESLVDEFDEALDLQDVIVESATPAISDDEKEDSELGEKATPEVLEAVKSNAKVDLQSNPPAESGAKEDLRPEAVLSNNPDTTTTTTTAAKQPTEFNTADRADDDSDEGDDSDSASKGRSKATSGASTPAVPQLSKKDKRRAKEKRKKEEAEAAEKSGNAIHACNVCGEQYASKTKLFDHIKAEGHAAAEGVKGKSGGGGGSAGGSGKKGGKKKR